MRKINATFEVEQMGVSFGQTNSDLEPFITQAEKRLRGIVSELVGSELLGEIVVVIRLKPVD